MQAEELISILIHLSRVDNKFDEFEFSYILNVGRYVGLADPIVESLIKDPELTDLTIPSSEEDRMTILYYLLFLMKIDQNISKEEKDLIQHYGFKLGFSKIMVDDFIDLMETYKESQVPTSKMIEIIKKYQN